MKYFLCLTFSLFLITDCFSKTVVSICAQSKDELAKAYKNAQFIKANDDVLRLDGTCIEVLTNQLRQTLYVKYLNNKNPNLIIKSTSNSSTNKKCYLVLTKKSKRISQVKNVENNKAQIYFNNTSHEGLKNEKNHIVIQDGMNGSMKFNHETLNYKCRIQKYGYNIELSSSSSKFNITSTVQIKIGQKIQIGTYQQRTNHKDQNVQITKNSFKSKEENHLITLYLEVQEGRTN